MSAAELPRGLGEAVLDACIRSEPEDFRVEEVLGFEASGSGEHLLLLVEKRGANTVWVAQRLARWAGIAEHGVGYAGLKDRHAVTRQAFTLHLPRRNAPDMDALAQERDFRVLDQAWHTRKLPRGALRGNRFVLRLRQLRGEVDAVETRLAQIALRGVPNYFGEQRFGRDGGNLAAARAMFAGRRVAREKRSILLSAVRSHLFNRVLAERVRQSWWDRGDTGEVWMLDGSHSVFGPEPLTPELEARCLACDIHPTGPLWGRGEVRSADAVQTLERAVLQDADEWREGLENAGLKQERRALRLPVRELTWRWIGSDLELEFFLPAGSYATAVLHSLGNVADVGLAPAPQSTGQSESLVGALSAPVG